jgi:hypothetical protein
LSTLTINDQIFTLVCGDRFSGRAVYRGPGIYLRIGIPALIVREEAIHRRLWAAGFPVAPLLQTGEEAGQPFFCEAALGKVVLGEIYEAEMQAEGAVSEGSFRHLLTVLLRWAEAQLRNANQDGTPADLAQTVRLSAVERLLPSLLPLTRQAFARAQQRLAVFPTVLTHGDFHPYNLCINGVIDLEMVHWSVAGYDVMSGLLDEDLLPPAPTDYRFTPQQRAHAFTAIDDLFQSYHLPPPSAYVDDFRICRMMRIVELAEKRPLAVQQWIYQQYTTLATAYIS